MPTITRDMVLEQLRTVKDPELHKDLVTLNMIKDVSVKGSRVGVHVELTTPACPLKDQISRDVNAAVRRISGVETVDIEWSAQVRSSRAPSKTLPGVKNVVAVGAGKGGVGKSTAAVLLAFGLKRSGASVGLMDSDVYGPSIPTMTGVEGHRPEVNGQLIVPADADGVKIMSIGFMVERDKPLIWRGPMAHGVVRQFLEQVDWGELDYLIVDLPPGTGDVPLTLAQQIPMTGAVVVCTPQDVALIDARRAVKMYEQLNVPCIGIIENMSYYLCPKCGHRDELFDHGGAAAAAKELGVPFLGEIPLNVKIRLHGDDGRPNKLFTDTPDYVQQAIMHVVEATAGQISVRSSLQVLSPTLTVE
ncbi:MAG: Mrp/NBP35 family ATP-binding protein [Planctomycetes bacterium]|nr:Mrp/NBP35 family ATP-binding protein [Planctomycetota bacterium]MBI3834038.1 Mrp/NBP35 family ATP-binding protein [Planctomycetota bacterium]